MARVPSKKTLKKSKAIKPVDISVPSYDSQVEDGDLLLINRGGVDYNTDAGDLAQYVGGELGIDSLVGEINTEIDGINASINENASDLSDLEARVEANEKGVAQNGSDIATNASGIATNVTAIAASDAENVRQNSWTGIPNGTNADTNATYQARITKNEADILALQGALVYEGVGDFSQSPDVVTTGHFYLCAADGTASGWTGLSTVEENSYYVYDGSKWEEAGSAAVVVPDPATGALTLASSNKGIDVEVGTGFNANSVADVEYQIKLDLNDEGGLTINDDGLGIAPKPNSGIIVDGDGISVDPDFIEANSLTDVPALQAVTDQGATTTNAIEAAGLTSTGTVAALNVTATGDQADSSFLFKDISQLPDLKDA